MSLPAEDNTPDEKNSLGLSGFLYGLGNSAKDGLISFVAVTAAFFALLTVGKKVPVLGMVAEKISDGTKWLHENKYGLSPILEKSKGTLPQMPEDLLEKMGLAAIVGAVASHFLQAPGFFAGKKKVEEAVNRYDTAITENQELRKIVTAAAENPDILRNERMQQRLQEIVRNKPATLEETVNESRDRANVNAR